MGGGPSRYAIIRIRGVLNFLLASKMVMRNAIWNMALVAPMPSFYADMSENAASNAEPAAPVERQNFKVKTSSNRTTQNPATPSKPKTDEPASSPPSRKPSFLPDSSVSVPAANADKWIDYIRAFSQTHALEAVQPSSSHPAPATPTKELASDIKFAREKALLSVLAHWAEAALLKLGGEAALDNLAKADIGLQYMAGYKGRVKLFSGEFGGLLEMRCNLLLTTGVSWSS